MKIPERFASGRFVSVVDPDRHLRHLRQTCCAFHFVQKGKAILHWFFSELNHFQIGLNHSCYVFGNSSTLYYIIVLAFTAFLGLICVEQVNAHYCYYLHILILPNICPCFHVCVQDMSMHCPFCPMFPYHSVPSTGYSSIYLSFSCHCITSY